jgi:hypothetical protein
MHIKRVEGFHNWTGNRVTCRDWFQLTLKEVGAHGSHVLLLVQIHSYIYTNCIQLVVCRLVFPLCHYATCCFVWGGKGRWDAV